jgi:hypothetical protein
MTTTRVFLAVLGLLCPLVWATSGCAEGVFDERLYDISEATRPYPEDLHTTQTADMQVFRDSTSIGIVNSTARSYYDFDLWINQRYVRHVDALPAGSSIRLSLWSFWDVRGERFYAGGFFASYSPAPVRLVEIQVAEDQPMIGLIALRGEDED